MSSHPDAAPRPRAPRPRLFYGWYIVLASFLTNLLLAGVFFQGFQVFFVPMVNYLGTSRAALSGAFTLRQLESGFLGPALGFVVGRVEVRKIIVLGGVIVGLGMMAMSQLTSLWMFYVLLLLSSVGASGVSHGITWLVVISRWFRRKRGLALGLGTSGPVLSGLVILAMSWLVQDLGWRWALFIAGVAVCLVTVPLGMIVRDSPQRHGLLPDGDSPSQGITAGVLTEGSAAQGQTVGEVLRDLRFWAAFVYFATLFFGTTGFQVHQVPYFEGLGFSTTEAAFTVVVVLLLSGIGRIGSGYLADFLDLRLILMGVGVMHAAGWAYLALVPASSLLETLPFSALFGISFGAMIPLRAVVLSRLFGERALGAIIGLLQGGALASGMISPVLMGRAFDVTGEYTAVLQIFAVATALMLPVVLLIRPPKKAVEVTPALGPWTGSTPVGRTPPR